MVITLTQAQACSLGWGSQRNRLLIRSCFYLGMGPTAIRELVRNPARRDEADHTISAALRLGMSDRDVITILDAEDNKCD